MFDYILFAVGARSERRLIDWSVAAIPERPVPINPQPLWNDQAGSSVRQEQAAFNLAEVCGCGLEWFGGIRWRDR